MGDDGKMTFEWKQANPEAARKAEVQAVHDRLARAIPPDRKARRPELAAVTVDTLRDVVAGQAVYIRNLENMVFHWEAVGQAALNEIADREKDYRGLRAEYDGLCTHLKGEATTIAELRRSLSVATEQLAAQGRTIVEKNASLNDATASLNYLRSRVNTLAAENERLHRALKRKRAPHG